MLSPAGWRNNRNTYVASGSSCTLDNVDMLTDGRADNLCPVLVSCGAVETILPRMLYTPVGIYWHDVTTLL